MVFPYTSQRNRKDVTLRYSFIGAWQENVVFCF
jgi:hypothetical protein